MKKTIVGAIALLSLFVHHRAQAQVSDVSFIVSPTAGYTFWNNNLNVGNSAFYGVRAGFGFGPILEIRANYERSFDLKGKLQGTGWNVANDFADKLENSKITYERIGGDLKFNLWNNARLTPYILGGAGVLKFHYDDVVNAGHRVHEEQLYGNVGAGLKINFAPRVALSLEARNMFFNAAPSSQYVVAGKNNTLQNWSALASLDVYLGGAPAAKDEVSKAYRQTFSGGFRGLRFVAEPSAAYLNFRNNAAFGDTWMLGVSAGVDFTTLVGLRGFYYRATDKPDALSTKLDGGLSIYGANLLTRLNVPRGVTPYLSLGAGYLNVDDKYSNSDPRFANAKSGWFALGGGGLEIPLHRMVSIFGSAEAMLMEQDNAKLDEVSNPSSININWMYRMGLRFNFGLKAKNGTATYQELVQAERDRALTQQKLREQAEAEHKAQQNSNNETNVAGVVANGNIVDTRAASEVDSQMVVHRVTETLHAEAKAAGVTTAGNVLLMNEAQLARVIQRVLQATQTLGTPQSAPFSQMSDLDKILLISALRSGQVSPMMLQQMSTPTYAPQLMPQNNGDNSKQVERLQQQIKQLEKALQQSHNNVAPVMTLPTPTVPTVSTTAPTTKVETTVKTDAQPQAVTPMTTQANDAAQQSKQVDNAAEQTATATKTVVTTTSNAATTTSSATTSK